MGGGRGLGHPDRQKHQGPVGLADDKVIGADMTLGADNGDYLAAARVERIRDPNLKCRTPGSMTLVRRARARRCGRGDRRGGWLVRPIGSRRKAVDPEKPTSSTARAPRTRPMRPRWPTDGGPRDGLRPELQHHDRARVDQGGPGQGFRVDVREPAAQRPARGAERARSSGHQESAGYAGGDH